MTIGILDLEVEGVVGFELRVLFLLGEHSVM
jgi:hypothetical protein